MHPKGLTDRWQYHEEISADGSDTTQIVLIVLGLLVCVGVSALVLRSVWRKRRGISAMAGDDAADDNMLLNTKASLDMHNYNALADGK